MGDDMLFIVIDKTTGQEPDLRAIAYEDWASNLVYTDIDDFYIGRYGTLILADECGNYAICPDDRFEIIQKCAEGYWQNNNCKERGNNG